MRVVLKRQATRWSISTPPGCDASPSQFASTHLSPGWREALWKKRSCPRTQHNDPRQALNPHDLTQDFSTLSARTLRLPCFLDFNWNSSQCSVCTGDICIFIFISSHIHRPFVVVSLTESGLARDDTDLYSDTSSVGDNSEYASSTSSRGTRSTG